MPEENCSDKEIGRTRMGQDERDGYGGDTSAAGFGQLDKHSIVVGSLGSLREVNGCSEPHAVETDRRPHWHLHHSPWEVNIVRWKALCRAPWITFEGIYCAVGNDRATFLAACAFLARLWNTSNRRGNLRSTLLSPTDTSDISWIGSRRPWRHANCRWI